ncbi:MAG TPA: FecR domain-containing protein [Sphingobacteriaceae bacterium]
MKDELLIKFLLRETDSEEDQRVNEWLAADSRNTKQLTDLKTLWDTSKALASQSSVDENAAWERFMERRDGSRSQRTVIRPLVNRSSWLRVAAAVLILVIGIWSVDSYMRTGNTQLATAAEVKTGILPDGTEVTLNKNSVLAYPDEFSEGTRAVELKRGEVFFNVKPDKAKPFVISADDIMVTVIGTTFNVRHAEQETEVIVETGVVKVTKDNSSVVLRAKEKVSINSRDAGLVKERVTDNLHNYYRSKQFVIDNLPLWRVVEILNEAYHSDIVIASRELKEKKLSTTFKEGSLDEILQVIAVTFEVTVEKRNGRIIIR